MEKCNIMGNLIKGIHHVSLKCSSEDEFDKTVEFYRDILGLGMLRSWDTGIMFDTGAGIIEIFSNGEEKLDKGTIRHFALATDDVDACVKAVKAAGYEVFIEPKNIEIQSEPVFHARIAFCIGPVGEEIEFFEERD